MTNIQKEQRRKAKLYDDMVADLLDTGERGCTTEFFTVPLTGGGSLAIDKATNTFVIRRG